MPLIQLTGAPQFEDPGTLEVIQMPNHPDKGTSRIVWRDVSRWVKKSDNSYGIPSNVKYSRGRFEMQFSGLSMEIAEKLIALLKKKKVRFRPRTFKTGDNSAEPVFAFDCRVVEAVRFTQHLKKRFPVLRIILETLAPICSVPPVTSSIRITNSAASTPNRTDGFTSIIDLGEYPITSDFWDNVLDSGANIRVRSEAGKEMPFELGSDFSKANRTCTIYSKEDFSDLSDTIFYVVTVDALAPTIPAVDALNGRQAVYGPNKWTWHLSQLPGTETLFDSSEHQADLETVNIDDTNRTFGPDSFGIELNNGVSDEYLQTVDAFEFPETFFMVEAWVNMRGSEANNVPFGAVSINNNQAGGPPLFELGRSEFDTWRFACSNTSDSVAQVLSAATVDDDEWVHLVGLYYSFDNLNHILRLYVNGSVANSDSVFVAPRSLPSGKLVIGARIFGDVVLNQWKGKIGQVTLYDGLPSSVNSIGTWVAKRYNQTKPNQTVFSVEPTAVKTIAADWKRTVFNDWFPKGGLVDAILFPYGLVDDEIIMVGGGSDTIGVNAKTSIYNIRTNEWRTGTDYPTNVIGAGFGVLNGELYIAGGWTGSTRLNTAYKRDKDTGLWQSIANVPIFISDCASVVFEGELWILGGFETGPGDTNKVYSYNPVSDTWTARTSLPAVRFGPSAGIQSGRIMVVGGISGAYQNQVWDLVGGSWISRTNYPSNVFGHRMTTYKDEVYVSGGQTSGANQLDTIYRYNQLSNNWTLWDTIPEKRIGHGAIENRGVLMVFCGKSSATITTVDGRPFEANTPMINDQELRSKTQITKGSFLITGGGAAFDPKALPGPGRRAIATGLINDRIYLVGGEDTAKYNRNDIYNPYRNEYNEGAVYPSNITAGAFGVWLDKLYLFGGFNGSSWVSTCNVYDPVENEWVAVANMPAASDGPSGSWYNGKFYLHRGSQLGLYIYDLETNLWTVGSAPPSAMFVSASAEFNGKIYWTSRFPDSNLVLRYDPAAASWATMNAFPTNHTNSRLFVYDGNLYCYVGDNTGSAPYIGQIYIYDEGLDSWAVVSGAVSSDPAMIPGIAVHGDRVHLFGGLQAAGHTTDHQIYSFKNGWL